VEFGAARLEWNAVVSQATGVVAFGGLLGTLVVAWFHGEKGPQPIRRVEIVLLTAVFLGAGTAVSLLSHTAPTSFSLPGGAAVPATLVEEDRPSVAALPWVNRSGAEADALFTDGIHDEILTRLSMIGGLRIISRQSVIQFRQSALSAREIASALGVRYLLEGGLLRAGDSVRLNVQLVDALTDDQVWAASYDRSLTVENLLAIQVEIATTIADTLRATVTAAERRAILRPETDDLAAYDFYLQGRSYFARPGYRSDDFRAAEELFTRAIRSDPEFALAHAYLSRIHGIMWWERFDPAEERLAAQAAAAQEALRLQPELAEAHVAEAWVHYVRGDFGRALEEYRAALALAPSDAEVVAGIGYTHRRMGDWPEVFAAFETAARLNPRDANLFYDLGGHSFGSTRRYAQAVAAYDRALDLAPDLHDAALARGTIFIHWLGQLDSIQAAVQRVPDDLHQPDLDLRRLELALWQRDPDQLLRAVQETPYRVMVTQLTYLPVDLFAGWAHRMNGAIPAALAAFESAQVQLEQLAEDRPDDLRILLSLGFAYAALGRAEEAERLASRAVSVARSAPGAPLGTRTLEDAARILAQAGRPDRAIDHLEQVMAGASALSGHSLRLDPLLDPLHGIPRFDALVEANLPPGPN
jgi:serine/threonine-protein kinase